MVDSSHTNELNTPMCANTLCWVSRVTSRGGALLAENFHLPSARAGPVPPRAQAQTPHPARLMPDGKQLSGRVLFTTDPGRARSFATVLLVGESLAECEG